MFNLFLFFKRVIVSIIAVIPLLFVSKNSIATSLPELIESLYSTDSSILSAESAVKEAENDIKTAWGAYLPDFDIKIEQGTESQWKTDAANSHLQFNEMDFTFKQKLLDFGETSSDISQKKNALEVAQLELSAAKVTLIIDAVDAYLGYIDAVKKLESEKETLQSKIDSTGQEESRVKKGSGMPSDVLQAKADLAGAQKSKIEAEGDLRKAYNKYVKVFKTEPPSSINTMQLIALSAEGNSQLPTSLDNALQAALTGNIDLQTKRIDLLDAEQDVVSASASFKPTLDFESTYKYKYNVGASAGSKEEALAKITFKLPLQPWKDLPDYRNKKYALLTAEDDLEEEEYATRQTISDLWEDYQVALLTRDFAVNKVVISEELLTIKKRERQLDQAEAGAVTAAENAVNDDRITLIDDETSLTETSLDLLEAMGVLTLASIENISDTKDTPASDQTTTEEVTEEVPEEVTEEVPEEVTEEATPEAAPVEPVVAEDSSEGTEQVLQQLDDLLLAAEETEQVVTEEVTTGCVSNTYIGQQQADGSWKTVCKE
jgi:adhesin transport system outer membrane protein